MAAYDFKVLNDKEFEELSRDLLNKKFSLQLQSFKKGKDKGIDLRFASPTNANSLIAQAKHYYTSGYKLLIENLKKETKKVKSLNPDTYIVITSVPLSANNQTEIKTLFHPYIKTENDVIGNETINAWLEEFPEIEKSHFKLWMSSSHVIDNILNRAVIGRSIFYADWIRNKIKLFVSTQTQFDSLQILLEKKVLIISGEPGIGKSTLADMICLILMNQGYDLYKIETIKEGEENFSLSHDEKQLFYFDDFLGSIYLELALSGNNTDSLLNSFIQRIRNIPNKLLIFTTRTVILNQAFSIYEKFKAIYSEQENIEIKLKDYDNISKAKILYNHLYFRDLSENHLNIFFENTFFLQVIKHPNYNPRIIDFITDNNKIETFTNEEYKKYIINTLTNPNDVWGISFQKQINHEQRFLLITLFSFREGVVNEVMLQEAYNARLNYEIKINGHIRSTNSYINSIKILLNGFIIRQVKHDGMKVTGQYISFINPSLADFLRNYLILSEEERFRMIGSFIYIQQFEKFIAALNEIKFSKKEKNIFSSSLLSCENILDSDANIFQLKRCKYLFNVLPESKEVLSLFKLINWNEHVSAVLIDIKHLLRNSKQNLKLYNYITKNFEKIISGVIKSLTDFEDYSLIPNLFEYYKKDLSKFLQVERNKKFMIEIFEELFIEFKESEIDELKTSITSEREIIELENKIQDATYKLDEVLLNSIYLDTEIDSIDWEKYIAKNTAEEDYDPSFYYGIYKEQNYWNYKVQTDYQDEDSIIKNLFDRS